MHSEDIKELATALCKAQGEIVGAKKDTESRPFKDNRVVINYADLASVWTAIKEAFTKNGLSVIQGTEQTEVAGKVLVVSTMFHTSGQWHRSELLITAPADMKLLGAALSYTRRYLLSAQAGVYQIDLDGLEGDTDTDTDTDTDNGNGSSQKIRTEEEKKALAEEIHPKSQGDESDGNGAVRFITQPEKTAFQKECFKLKIPTAASLAMLKQHDISAVDKIPADRFDELFKALEFLASELNEKK